MYKIKHGIINQISRTLVRIELKFLGNIVVDWIFPLPS